MRATREGVKLAGMNKSEEALRRLIEVGRGPGSFDSKLVAAKRVIDSHKRDLAAHHEGWPDASERVHSDLETLRSEVRTELNERAEALRSDRSEAPHDPILDLLDKVWGDI